MMEHPCPLSIQKLSLLTEALRTISSSCSLLDHGPGHQTCLSRSRRQVRHRAPGSSRSPGFHSTPGNANARWAGSSTTGGPEFWSSRVCGLAGMVPPYAEARNLSSERDRGAALEAERLARFVWGGGLAVEEVGQSDGLLDQLGVGLRTFVAADAEVVLEADAHVAAQHQAHRGEVVLRGVADARGGEGEVVAEEIQSRAAHVHELLYGGCVRAHDAENELDVDRGVEQSFTE